MHDFSSTGSETNAHSSGKGVCPNHWSTQEFHKPMPRFMTTSSSIVLAVFDHHTEPILVHRKESGDNFSSDSSGHFMSSFSQWKKRCQEFRWPCSRQRKCFQVYLGLVPQPYRKMEVIRSLSELAKRDWDYNLRICTPQMTFDESLKVLSPSNVSA